MNISNYVNPPFFPDSFLSQTMDGPHVGPHSADLVRLPLLYLYGGVWLDVGFLLFKHLDDFCWNTLEDESTLLEMAGFMLPFGRRTTPGEPKPEMNMMFNGFIASRRGNVCIKYWHDIFCAIWQGVTEMVDVDQHPLLRHLPRYELLLPRVTGSSQPPFTYSQFVNYIAQMLCLERLRHLLDPSTGWNGPEYFAQRVLLFDCVQEVYWAQHLTRWDGRKQFELLGTLRDGEGATERSKEYKEAKAFVQGILANSSTMKISHGLPSPGREYLAEIWDRPENQAADIVPGSFAAYLRWASEHFESERRLTRVLMPTFEPAVLVGGVIEVMGQAVSS